MKQNHFTEFSAAVTTAHPGLTAETVQTLYDFFLLVLRDNDSHDLSRLKKIPDIIKKHFVDSILVNRLTTLPSPLLDIGTGAGFPGIPLKIVNPALALILGEPRPLRVSFMEEAIETLALSDTRVFPHKVTEKMHFSVNGVITRAFEAANATLERCVHFLPAGGQILLLKGPGVTEELHALTPSMHRYYSLAEDISYTLPDSSDKRRLIIFTKTSDYAKRFFLFSDIPELTAGRQIASADNSRYKTIKRSTHSGGIKKTGITCVSGSKVIAALLAQRADLAEELIIYDSYSTSDRSMLAIIEQFRKQQRLLILKKSLFHEIDTTGSKQPLCVISVPEIPDIVDTGPGIRSMIALPFQDPVNTGSIIRSACAFGIESVLMTGQSAHPYHAKSIRASAGTVFSAPLCSGPSLEELPEYCDTHRITPVTLDMKGVPLEEYTFPERCMFIPGVEGPGLPDALKQYAVSIPMEPGIESLNASVSGAVLLYEYYKRHGNRAACTTG